MTQDTLTPQLINAHYNRVMGLGRTIATTIADYHRALSEAGLDNETARWLTQDLHQKLWADIDTAPPEAG